MQVLPPPPVRSSRSVERIVLQKELGKKENDMTKANQTVGHHEEVIRKLRKENGYCIQT
jgi:hypothetical protein